MAMEPEEERSAKLQNVAATKLLRLAMEMDEERKTRLEKMVATKRLRLAIKTGQRKKRKTGEDGSYHTAQVGPGDRGRKKSKKKICEFNLY